MKLLSFTVGGRRSFGAVKDDGVIDLGRRMSPEGIESLRRLLKAGRLADAETMVAGQPPDYSLEQISFAPVVPNPGKIICVGLNYRDHVEETGRTVTEKPTLFARYPSSQVGHLQPLIKPKVSDQFDYEGEVAVVMGRYGRHIAAKDALRC